MSLAHLIKHVIDGLWALGGIGAAADLCLEYCESVWDADCPLAANEENTSQEGGLCKVPCLNCSSRH